MPPFTDSIASVRRERDRLVALRREIRERLAERGTLTTKRAIREAVVLQD